MEKVEKRSSKYLTAPFVLRYCIHALSILERMAQMHSVPCFASGQGSPVHFTVWSVSSTLCILILLFCMILVCILIHCCFAWYWCASHYCWWLQPSRGCFLTPPEKFCSCSNNSVGWVWERIAQQDCKTAGGRDEHIKCNTSLRLFPVPTIDTVFHKRVAT